MLGDDGVSGSERASGTVVSIRSEPHVMFQHVKRDANYARIAVSPLGEEESGRAITPLECERVHYAGGRGLCLGPDGFFQTYRARIFDAKLTVLEQVKLPGIPSRARVSPDGRYGATTVFVSGDSYADEGFSTRTNIIDLRRGRVLGHLEQFEAIRDGEKFRKVDFNYWGVTFARHSNRFYATLATGGNTYLVEGDVAARTVRVLHENVECPSLSPDNSRVAYKKLVGEGPAWRLHVLDLRTMEETALAEERPIDDQVEWLDDENILYGLEGDVWVVPADGGGSPSPFLDDALSPAVVA